jgi:hypothetical protein
MGYIYNADMFCDDCGEEIENDFLRDARRAVGLVTPVGFAYGDDDFELSFDPDDEGSYDSEEYPKHYSSGAESDCPQHCGECGVFLENDLTTDGADYVRNAVREDLASGCDDSIALTVWFPYYSWLDWKDIGNCDDCGKFAICEGWEGSDLCPDCFTQAVREDEARCAAERGIDSCLGCGTCDGCAGCEFGAE